MITLYQYEISPFCDKLRRVMNYKKVPYQLHDVSVMDTINGAYKKINPIGKVPAINDDGHVLVDSTHIARYLDDKFPQPSLYPTDKKQAALAHMLEDWADESLYFYEMYLRLVVPHNASRWIGEITKTEPFYIKTIAPTVIPAMMSRTTQAQGVGRKSLELLAKELRDHVTAIAEWLSGGQWLVGDKLSIADISVFCQLYCLDGTQEGAAVLNDFPEVKAWMLRVDMATRMRS